MTRNQLKLRIWNSLNGKFLSNKTVDALINGFDDDELGAFVVLYTDSRCSKVFLDIQSKTQDGNAFFISKEAKEAVRKYLEILKNGYMTGMRNHVRLADLEEIICSLSFDVTAEQECGRVSEARGGLLDYCRVLRARLDCPAIGTESAESNLFALLRLNYEGALLYDAFMVFEMYIEEIHDIEKLAEFYETHDLALELYVRELDNAFDNLVLETYL